MKRTRNSWILAFALICLASAGQAKESIYSKSTLVVYNRNFSDAEALAKHYANIRGISSGRLISLDCPNTEEITRAEYEETIANPLRKVLDKDQWKLEESSDGKLRAVSNQTHVLALIRGIPLKIKHGGDPQAAPQNVDAASVDSELAVLGNAVTERRGMVPNPYYKKKISFAEANLPQLMLVCRLDGPTLSHVQSMIDDSEQTERVGLWGRAYVDIAQLDKEKGPDYKLGDDWLRKIASQLRSQGISLAVDNQSTRFPSHYPMKDCALYFGWYVHHADGPFVDPEFHFKKGAVACHLHSYSAATLRSETECWAGPLIAKGAVAVLGNVYEPFLMGTTNLDLFVERLLDGYTFGEATFMATPYLSWMTVGVGDPLYRPFDGLKTFEAQFYRNDEDTNFKTYLIATRRWGNQEVEFEAKLRQASANHKTGFYFESFALRKASDGDPTRAIELLRTAEGLYPLPADRLRVRLHEVEMERQRGNRERAVAVLKELQRESQFTSIAEGKSIKALLNQIDPPGPAVTPK